jgi:2,3-bisphosphoglycerate-independent phosphoglycerate mutase
MMDFDVIRSLLKPAETKIVLLLLDGLGGLPQEPGGLTELETAETPNLDRLAAEGICGLHQPIGPGIIPGSGPAHIGVFGYNPLHYQVGRGVLEALGVDFPLSDGDVATRGNFCTIDEQGLVTDRRAGRISTEKNRELCVLLSQIKLPGVELFVQTVKEHRLLLVLRGEGLSGEVGDTDPQAVGKKPKDAQPLVPDAEKTASLINQFQQQAREILAPHHPANMVVFRGFAQRPDWPTMKDVFGLRCAAVATYPMYRGLSKLVGMDTVKTGDSNASLFDTLEDIWQDYDFFFLHVKGSDSAGEDGDFDRKVKVIEEVDRLVPRLTTLNPDVVLVTGDHSTPAILKSHSWHPVPVLLWSKYCRTDPVEDFGERACMWGGLGPSLPAIDLLPIALANAGRLEKFGA